MNKTTMQRDMDKCHNCRSTIEEFKTQNKILNAIFSLPRLYYPIFIEHHLEKKDLNALSKEYHVTRERIRKILLNSRDRLHNYGIDYDYEMIREILLNHVNEIPFVTTKTIYVLDKELLNKASRHTWYSNFNITWQIPEKIEDLNMSARTTNGLKNSDINTVEELLQNTEEDLLEIKNFGKKCVNEIIDRLKSLSLRLKSIGSE